jgi:hypothetical protein
MSYYTGDYYRGDYYRGDPGLFSFLGKAFGGIAKGFISGGPLGAFTGGLAAVTGRTIPVPRAPTPTIPGTSLLTSRPPGGVGIGYFNPAGGGVGLGYFPEGGGGGGMGGGGTNGQVPGVMRGFHLNRSTYETRGGGTSRWGGPGTLAVHPKGTVMVRNRRMNVGNASALRHALRRAYGFERLARRVLHLTSPKRHFSGFKKKRARR